MNSSQISTSGGMSAERLKEAIQELQEWIYTTEADVESWGPRKEHHPLWQNYRDTKDFLASLKEPEEEIEDATCQGMGKFELDFAEYDRVVDQEMADHANSLKEESE
jgi:hypothetical protein